MNDDGQAAAGLPLSYLWPGPAADYPQKQAYSQPNLAVTSNPPNRLLPLFLRQTIQTDIHAYIRVC